MVNRLASVIVLSVALLGSPTGAGAACVGDCDGDGAVTVAEVVRLVNVALQLTAVETCPAGDADGNGAVTIDELITAVGAALAGCGPAVTGPWVQGDPAITASDCDPQVDMLIRQIIEDGGFDCIYDLQPGAATLRETCGAAIGLRPAALDEAGEMTSTVTAELTIDRCRITLTEALSADLTESPTVAHRALDFRFTRPCRVPDCAMQLDAPWGLPPRLVGLPVYVTDIGQDALWIIDSGTHAVVGPAIAAGDAPVGVAVTPDGRRAYVTNAAVAQVSVVVLGVRALHNPVPVGPGPAGIAVAPDGTRVYVADQGNLVDPSTVTVVATATNQVIASPLGSVGPSDIAISPDGARAYVANFSSLGLVSVLDTASDTFIGAGIAVGGTPRGVAVTPDGRRAYVTASDFVSGGWVSVVDLGTGAVVGARIPVGFFPQDVAVTPDGTRVLVTIPLDNRVAIIATASNAVVATVAVGGNPQYLAITPDGREAYVTEQDGRSVAVIDLDAAAVAATIPLPFGSVPVGVAIGRAFE